MEDIGRWEVINMRRIKDPTFNIYKDGGNVENKQKQL